MSRPLVFATRNQGKLVELRQLLPDVNVIDIEDAARLIGRAIPDVVEDADTFVGNATKKAREVSDATRLPALADDSGLEVDAIGGDPGVFSARYAGVTGAGADAANNAKLLAELAGIHGPNRRARFRCVLVLAGPDTPEVVAQGAIEGFILPAAQGAGGFGYDPLFQPEGDTRSLAEYAPEEKNRVSHRGQAARQLVSLLTARGGLAP